MCFEEQYKKAEKFCDNDAINKWQIQRKRVPINVKDLFGAFSTESSENSTKKCWR